MSVRVENIRLENVFGVEFLEFDPDGVTILKGRNGSGKTSVIRALHQLFAGGQNEEALRKGTENGEVRLELDDGTEVWASVTENHIYYKTNVEDMTGRQMIESLYDEISVNPISILEARPQDRGQILLEALPMRVDEDELYCALSPIEYMDLDTIEEEYLDIDLDDHALDVLGDNSSGVIGALADERQSMYGAKRNKEGTVNELEDSVGGLDKTSEELKEKRDATQEKLMKLRAEKQDDLDEVNSWEKKKIEEIRKKAKEKRDKVRDRHDADIKEAEAKRERLNEKIEQAERQQQTLETIEQRKKELEQLDERYSALSEAIDNLRDLKTSYRADLPEDVTIDEGEIYDTDGIPFENWNEERKIRFATMIAEMRMGDLQIIPVDGIEKLVGEQRDLFLSWAEESPAQFILTEAVAGQSLTVEHSHPSDPLSLGEDAEGSDGGGSEATLF